MNNSLRESKEGRDNNEGGFLINIFICISIYEYVAVDPQVLLHKWNQYMKDKRDMYVLVNS